MLQNKPWMLNGTRARSLFPSREADIRTRTIHQLGDDRDRSADGARDGKHGYAAAAYGLFGCVDYTSVLYAQ